MDPENNNFDIKIIELLKDLAKSEGFQKYEIKKLSGSLKGDGYLGDITATEIIDITNPHRKLRLVIKSAVKSEALRSKAPIVDVFQREIYMYDSIIPALRSVEIEKGFLPFPSFAKCYRTSLIQNSECLVLENLTAKGFKVWERRTPMNEDHVALVLKEYGRFHALSLALKDQNPIVFNNLTKSMDDLRVKFYWDEDGEKFSRIIYGPAFKAFCPVRDVQATEALKRVTDTASKYLSYIAEFVDDYSVVLHGDGWANNIMFGYDDFNKPTNPTKLCFIDLQLARLGPPVLDLTYFFYTCSSKSVITNYDHYLNIYYTSLSNCLQKLGSDPNKIFPYSVFRQQWKEFAKYGLLKSIFLIKLMLSEQNEAADLAKSAEAGKTVIDAFDYDLENANEYNDRIRHIVFHCIENKFI